MQFFLPSPMGMRGRGRWGTPIAGSNGKTFTQCVSKYNLFSSQAQNCNGQRATATAAAATASPVDVLHCRLCLHNRTQRQVQAPNFCNTSHNACNTNNLINSFNIWNLVYFMPAYCKVCGKHYMQIRMANIHQYCLVYRHTGRWACCCCCCSSCGIN